jgi:heat shock protein HslJ
MMHFGPVAPGESLTIEKDGITPNVSCDGRTRAECAILPSIAMADELQTWSLAMARFRYLNVFVVALLGVGCAGSSSTPTAPSSDQLTGTWNLVSIQPAGQAEQPTPPGARYTLSFADGRLSTRVDCNMCSGAFSVNGQTFTAGPALACTRAACPTMAFENAYTGLLSGDSTLAVAGNALVLSSPRGALRFTR